MRRTARRGLALLLVAAPTPARADTGPFTCGFSLAATSPLQGDLRRTTGNGPGIGAGVHGTWRVARDFDLRLRADGTWFPEGREVGPGQFMRTHVRQAALGLECLYRFRGKFDRLSAGPGLYLVRWSLDAEHRLEAPTGGTMIASSTSVWNRQGLGLVSTVRMGPRTSLEGRVLFSHYGYENHPVRTASLGLLWHF